MISSYLKRIKKVFTYGFFITVGQNTKTPASIGSNNSVSKTSLPPSSSNNNGRTEIFNYGKLRLEVTNVCEVKVDNMTNDMGKSWEYTVYVCHSGARATVLNADMSHSESSDNDESLAEWAILSTSDKRRDIVEGMKPFNIPSNILYVYEPELGMAVLEIEMLAT